MRTRLVAVVAAVALGLSGCAPAHKAATATSEAPLRVVTTTGILRDLVTNVGGARVAASSIVPDGADPHSYEPTLRSVRDVVYADVAFSNYLMLEQHSVIKTLDANLRSGVPNISLAEAATRHGAEVIPLVEHVSLDTIWLGLRVRGKGTDKGADRASEVRLQVRNVEGPGTMYAYLTETFGKPRIVADSSKGFNAGDGYAASTFALPLDAHTHMSWVFTQPGIYRVTYGAELTVRSGARPYEIPDETVTFAVGVDPNTVPGHENSTVLDSGHADITADVDTGEMYIFADISGGGEYTQKRFEPESTVISVPAKALTEIPGGPHFRFLGSPGDQIYQLPQAVLGAHVHGEIDPHLWHDVRNVKAYVKVIRDTLSDKDPDGRSVYYANAQAYLDKLDALDAEMTATIASIPPERRYLITTHDAFGYLAKAYGLKVAGFVTPNPATEPSIVQRRKLARTIETLKVPAVFLEAGLIARSSTLAAVAKDAGVQVCPILSDTFTPEVSTYLDLMRYNAQQLKECLTS
ncbi:anchored repeat ABC transporter, substrate-binding protein [Bowdeniella nasicola]|uniref:Anchored repeat ABC transporter, substrate-binding protein n=1 Tax=Bowdeniella nasicola TaxID=208480 RepID=A0A1Q5Q3F0_9ACTO|nr:anchored repeat ABC transporter, substrate-binding protein [Bowdeniella nasicola]OKL54353.1 anchored repeat ABC transporter, substrate-binding protein [Bowdeniella nasicola]